MGGEENQGHEAEGKSEEIALHGASSKVGATLPEALQQTLHVACAAICRCVAEKWGLPNMPDMWSLAK